MFFSRMQPSNHPGKADDIGHSDRLASGSDGRLSGCIVSTAFSIADQ
jgi:hypothetical protein